QKRHLDLVPVGHSRLPVFVGVELARDAIFVKVASVLAELFIAERFRTGDPVAGHATLEATRAAAVLQGVDLRARPVLHEAAAEYSSVMRHVAVEVGGAFPGADGGQMFGLQ